MREPCYMLYVFYIGYSGGGGGGSQEEDGGGTV